MEKEEKGRQGQGVRRVLCATLDGIESKEVEVESSFTRALPGFSIVGLASNSIQEAKERVKSALLSCGFRFPPLKITINLSPSDLKKSGSHFDLAIALSIALHNESCALEDFYIFGELGLDGKLKSTATMFALVVGLANKPIKVIAPKEAASMLGRIPNVSLYIYDHLDRLIEDIKAGTLTPLAKKPLEYQSITIKGEPFYYQSHYPIDFAQVKGQERAKRAALIAAAGMHNILFEGSPGCGKSMIIQRMRYILPPLALEELLEIARVEALAAQKPSFTPLRPYRAPHHTATKASLFGGGSQQAKPGEVALAHLGMLFFDELPHFSKHILEALREPLQDRRLLISRVNAKMEYPTKFLFAAAQNPCPCGNLLSSTKECRCTELEIARYRNKVSEPLLDRIELYVQMDEVKIQDASSIDSGRMHQQVIQAFKRQKERGQKECNAHLSEEEIERVCLLDQEATQTLHMAITNLGLSHRGVANVKKVARTIADLEGAVHISKSHLLEALSFRRR